MVEEAAAMTAIVHVFVYGLMACNIAFLFIDLVRYRAVKGSRLRYVCATIQWALVPPALVFPALLILAGRHIVGAFGFLTALWCLYDLCRSDDDNWWRRKRKQLRERLATMRLRPNLAGVRS